MDLEMGDLIGGSQKPPLPSAHEQKHHAKQSRMAALAVAAWSKFWRPPLRLGERPRIEKSRKHLIVMIFRNLEVVDTRAVEDYPSGYPRLGCFMNSDESFLIYRRFGGVFSRLILNKQDELRAMEQRLFVLDQVHEKENPRRLMSRTYDLQPDADANEDPKGSRSFLLAQMERTALEYCKVARQTPTTKNLQHPSGHLLMHAQQLVAMERPTASERRNVQTYINNTNPLTFIESDFLSDESDLITLRPGRSLTMLDGLVKSIVRLLNLRITNVLLHFESVSGSNLTVSSTFTSRRRAD